MNRRIVLGLAIAALLGLGEPWLLSGQVQAQDTAAKPLKTRRTPAIREQVYKRLARVQELLDADEKDLETARNILLDLLKRHGQNSYEQASAHNMLAFIAYSDDDFVGAIRHYELVLADRPGIPRGLEQATVYTLAQLNFVQERYAAAIDYLNDWFSGEVEPSPPPYVFLAQIYYQMQNYRKALPLMEKAVGIAQERGMLVRENWWLLLRAMYFAREDYDKVIEIVEILVRDFPKRSYWVQLSGLYGQENKEIPQLQAIDAAYIDVLLEKEREVLNLVGLLMQSDVFYRAGTILEQAMADGIVERNVKNMKMLAQAWQIAREIDKAIPVLEVAAKKAKEGDLHLHLAQVYLEKDKFDGCVNAIDQALRKGKLKKKKSLAYEVRGMCHFSQELLTEADESFKEAKRIAQADEDETTTDRLDQWLRYVKQEERRLQILKNS